MQREGTFSDMTRRNDRKPKSQKPEPFDEAFGELLCAYLDDELTPPQRAEVEARLASDPTAQSQLEALTTAADAMRNLPRGSAPASILEDITAQSERADILGKPEESVTLARHKRGPFRSTMALAAMLMVAVSASLYVSLKGQQNSAITRGIESANSQSANKPNASKSSPANESTLAMMDESKNRGRELFEGSDSKRQFDGRSKPLAKNVPNTSSTPVTESRMGLEQEVFAEADAATPTRIAIGSDRNKQRRNVTSELRDSADLGDSTEFAFDSIKEKKDAVAPEDSDKLAFDMSIGQSTVDDLEPKSELKPTNTSPPPTAVAPAKRKLQANRLAKLDADMTFEQKLIAGADATIVADHPFPNEPLQLSVSFENDAEQAAGEGKLQAFLARNDFRVIDSESQSGGYLRSNLNQPGENDKGTADSNGFEYEAFFVGREAQNYSGPANSRQYLVRLKSDRLGEVVNDLSTVGAEQVQIRVGNVRSENPEQLWQLASQAAGTEFKPPPQARTQAGRLRRAESKEGTVENATEEQATIPESAQWINALQAYGLLASDAAEESERAGQRASGYGGYAGSEFRAQSKGADATSNGIPGDSAIADLPMSENEAKKQQTLLTLVIELVNDQAPGKKEPPTKVKQ
ncbi:MAG: hypothetical protein DHS20C16_25220 [Phycisphaerae bacterium]|nr:MAG: hypothetical protein DHS20C16_25220 [Phycisphaerae bacterium]